MAIRQLNDLLRHVRTLGGKDQASKLNDRLLLERFETLLARHGPMVLDVCRRVLHDAHAAEDAFQATFLVLAHKAAAIRNGALLGNWLYGVAYRTAARAKVERARRRVRERAAPAREPTGPLTAMTVRELFAVLDDELSQLPTRYRAPLIFCYLESRARAAVARQLGCSLATLDRRLERGRDLLRARLVRRGVAPCAALLPVLLSQSPAAACVPTPLGATLARAATEAAVGGAPTTLVSAQVATLTQGVLQAMFLTRMKIATLLVLLLGVLGTGTGILLQETLATRHAVPDDPLRRATKRATPKGPSGRTDFPGILRAPADSPRLRS